MDHLISDVRAALAAGLYVVALQGSLALVDICAAVESEDGRSRGYKFKLWFTNHLGSTYTWFDGEDAWQLRCGMLHQGRAASDTYKSIIFTLPNQSGYLHNVLSNDCLILDLAQFCGDVLEAVEVWWFEAKDGEPVATHERDIVRIRPHGLSPYIVGVPVLA